MASGIPGTARSMTSSVASGVQSRGEKPVPPVVRMRLVFSLSHKLRSTPKGLPGGSNAPAFHKECPAAVRFWRALLRAGTDKLLDAVILPAMTVDAAKRRCRSLYGVKIWLPLLSTSNTERGGIAVS